MRTALSSGEGNRRNAQATVSKSFSARLSPCKYEDWAVPAKKRHHCFQPVPYDLRVESASFDIMASWAVSSSCFRVPLGPFETWLKKASRSALNNLGVTN